VIDRFSGINKDAAALYNFAFQHQKWGICEMELRKWKWGICEMELRKWKWGI